MNHRCVAEGDMDCNHAEACPVTDALGMAYLIDKNVPMPHSGRRYPFAEMEIGDSFFIAREDRHRVSCAADAYRKQHGRRFSFRNVGEGTRCWRVS